jgi:hypothetical protein
LRLTLLLRLPVQRFGRTNILANVAASAVVVAVSYRSVSGGPLTGRESPF